jgi:hypothetical protein
VRLVVATLLILLVAIGCASNDQKQGQDPVAISTPLALDPTESYEIAEWWTNGKQLLQLSEIGVYRLYPGINQYHTPMERGQWSRRNYAALWIEPYAELPRQPARVPIRKVAGELQLDVHSLQPMSALDGPPDVIEDHLIGGWTGDIGSLLLEANLRYVLHRRKVRTSGPASLASEEGGWKVQDDFLILQPDSRGIRPTVVRVHLDEDGLFLESPDGRLEPQALPFGGS